MTWKKAIAFFSAAFLALILLVGAAKPDLYFLIKKNFSIFSEVYREAAINYVDEVDPEKLMRTGINAMLESLDPYTVFIDEADRQTSDIISQGSYGGIGLTVGVKDDDLVVISPIEGYSAYKKGIRAGDIIVDVNDIPVSNRTAEEVQSIMIGEPGTTVSMTIKRYGVDQELTYQLQRERIKVKNVDYAGFADRGKSIGYISLARFSQNAASELLQAFENLQAESTLKGLIIDLRNNPGGLLTEAVDIVDIFIGADQNVVEICGRLQDRNEVFKSKRTALAPSLPLVVLQNNGSASASEIVAGSLQDLDRAVIMGTQSFGKGLVQIIQPLSYNTALKMTTARYYIPSGRSIQSVTYGHDEQNNAIQKPDSLRRSYQTKNGRTVYDGQGITPDVPVEDHKLSVLETVLLHQSQIFNFVNRYIFRHDSYTHETLPESTFDEFKIFLEENDFTYVTPSEKKLQKIVAVFEQKDESSSEIMVLAEDLQKAIDQQKERAFIDQAPMIKKLLHLELTGRYQGNKEKKAVSLKIDPLLEEALEILNNVSRYNSMLSKTP